MPRPVPLSAEVVGRVVDLLQAGVGRNATARAVGVSASSVSKIAAARGVSFPGAAVTARATECARVDAAVVRARRERELLAAQAVAVAAGRVRAVRRIEKRLVDLHRFHTARRSGVAAHQV